MRNIEKKELETKMCKDCTNCKRSNGVYYCTKGHCPFSDEDYKLLKENEKK